MIEPVNSRRTSRCSEGSSGARSMVTIGRPVPDSRVIRPWPISPLAPVTKVTGVRMWRHLGAGSQPRAQPARPTPNVARAARLLRGPRPAPRGRARLRPSWSAGRCGSVCRPWRLRPRDHACRGARFADRHRLRVRLQNLEKLLPLLAGHARPRPSPAYFESPSSRSPSPPRMEPPSRRLPPAAGAAL